MSNSEALRHNRDFQYRLRFFHKCRSPGVCDPAQLDRYQVQGSAIESTCGAPIIAVLVRYRHDPESGLSRECQRAQFAPGKAMFAVKAVIVPADRVLEYMDQTILEQPVLVDSQGRNVLGGPDVSPDGCIYATPLEQNGIAHLNNFCMMQPWNGPTQLAASSSFQWQQQEGYPLKAGRLGRVSDSGARMEGGLGGGSRMLKDSSDGGGCSSELCLLVQLLKRDSQQCGKWFAYNIPHLVSRPFQVISRAELFTLHSPSAMMQGSYMHQQLMHERQPTQPQAPVIPQRQRLQSMSNLGLGAIPALTPCGSGPGPTSNRGVAAGLKPQDLGLGYVTAGMEGGMSFQDLVLRGGSVPGGMANAGGGVGGRRHSSHSSGSPHAAGSHRRSRSRRRSCLSRDSSHDDGSVGAPAAVGAAGKGPMRTPSSVSAAEVVTSGAPQVTPTLGASPPLSPPSRLVSVSATTMEALVEAAGSRASGGVLGEGRAFGLQQAPSATLMDLNISDFLAELQAQPPLLADDAMELEGPPKRVKSNSTTSDVAAFLSGNRSSDFLASSQPNMAAHRHLHKLEAYLSRSANASISTDAPILADHQSRAGSWSADMPTEQLLELRKQSTGLSGNTAESFAARSFTTRSAGGVARECLDISGGAVAGTASQLDALVHLLGQPGAMQDALDRMDQEQHRTQVFSGDGEESMQV